VKVVAIIQARLTSTRFPRKVLADLGGTSVLERVLSAACHIDGVDEVVIGWPVVGIPENDVLARYVYYAQLHKADAIMRLTGDCPLFDPQVGALVLQAYRNIGSIGYASNVYPRRTWPDGMDCEVFSYDYLVGVDAEPTTTACDREHVTPAIQRMATQDCRYISVELPVDWSWVRLTVDTPEDLAWLKVAIDAPRSGSPSPVK
jgi:spore coat polysaccharide biosynthesis protein SpsF (cytidylyltransferase family)